MKCSIEDGGWCPQENIKQNSTKTGRMITARPQKNLRQAKSYFREHLGHGDYYSASQTVRGVWFGKGAERLGLVPGQPVGEEAFLRLCDNLKPLTGEQLTVRQRKVDRRVFHDFVVAPPKSVSVMALVVGDPRIVEAHAASSLAALQQMEQVAVTRVRKGGQVQDRVTGEIVAAAFQHDASRSLDPQLHTHFVVFNATWDAVEERWKALETRRMFEHLGFFTEVYRTEMTRRLQSLGYGIRTTTTGFEIEGVSEDIIQRFSKRRHAIVAESKRLEQEFGKVVSNNGRAAIAHAIRERKIKDLDPAEVRAFQRAQLSETEMVALERLTLGQPVPKVTPPTEAARVAIDFARDHLFERKSVVHRRELFREALKHARSSVTLGELETELARRTEFLIHDDQLATKSGLNEEKRLIALVNGGIGQCPPLRASHTARGSLNEEQHAALAALLNSPDRVMALRGVAGTGKTEVLRELVEAVTGRHEVIAVAPTKTSVQALQQAGLPAAQTVQHFLTNERFKASLRHPLIVVDEAGLLSNRQMLELIELTHTNGGRLVLAGDTRQHASVEAGDALRILERHSALQTIPLRQIQRQIDLEYRAAIADFAEDRGARAVSRLQQLGAVEVLDTSDRCRRAAEAYVTSIQAGKTALVVCPTWREADDVNASIRTRLQAADVIGQKESTVTAHRSLKWTVAQKQDFQGYEPGLILNFHKTTRTFQAGDSTEVIGVKPDRLIVKEGHGRTAEITRKQTGCFDVAQPMTLALAKGDRLLIQGNRKSAKMINGHLVTVERVKANGEIGLTNGQSIPVDFRLFTYGHAVTSQSAQGRTVDHAIVSMDQHSLAAHEKMLYVGASRGREQLTLLVDDDDTLHRALERPGTRISATEMLQAARQQQAEQATQRKTVRMKM